METESESPCLKSVTFALPSSDLSVTECPLSVTKCLAAEGSGHRVHSIGKCV